MKQIKQNHQIKQIEPMKVLVTRPHCLAESLIKKLCQSGFLPESFPVMEFRPSTKQSALTSAIQQLNQTHIAVFVSQTAAEYGMRAIQDQISPELIKDMLSPIMFAAIGLATQKMLASFGLKNIICPLNSPYESESLLAHPALERVQNKNIIIFRGNKGRDQLAKTLEQRGANLRVVECYTRQIPGIAKTEIATRLNAWRQDKAQVILTTSADILLNLQTLVGPKGWQVLQKQAMVVVGLRMKALAANLGVQRITLAKDADDASLIEALMNIRNSIR